MVGTLLAVSATEIDLRVTDSKKHQNTVVFKVSQTAELGRAKDGDAVDVVYVEDGNRRIAVAIIVAGSYPPSPRPPETGGTAKVVGPVSAPSSGSAGNTDTTVASTGGSLGEGTRSARHKYESIEAEAFSTGTSFGQNIGITVVIYDFSTAADRQILVDAFAKGQNQGLVNALTKMPPVGRISITGTLGYDLSYIRMIATPTGRKIRFVTDRQIRFGEAYADSQSMNYNLTAGEIDINDQDKNKSTGTLYPLAQLTLDKEGQLQLGLRQNPWRLSGIIDSVGTKSY